MGPSPVVTQHLSFIGPLTSQFFPCTISGPILPQSLDKLDLMEYLITDNVLLYLFSTFMYAVGILIKTKGKNSI
jgi:hypothetical protein